MINYTEWKQKTNIYFLHDSSKLLIKCDFIRYNPDNIDELQLGQVRACSWRK